MQQKKKTEMYPLVKKWQQSGQSKLSFSRSHGVKTHTFHYWVKKYELEHSTNSCQEQSNNFIPLLVSGQSFATSSNSELTLSYPNGVRLVLSSQVTVDYLLNLIKIGSNV